MSNPALGLVPGVLEFLALPSLADLTDEQARGVTCVWGGERLTTETAVDLGEQPEPGRWFPRACRQCAAGRAHQGLFAHGSTCRDCADDAAACPVGRGLYRLVRECRR